MTFSLFWGGFRDSWLRGVDGEGSWWWLIAVLEWPLRAQCGPLWQVASKGMVGHRPDRCEHHAGYKAPTAWPGLKRW